MQPVTVTLDATSLEPGVHLAGLVVITNDPLNGKLSTTVTLTVSS